MTSPTEAHVLCSLCGEAGTVDTDTGSTLGIVTVLWWSSHFETHHPEVTNPSAHLIMTGPGA